MRAAAALALTALAPAFALACQGRPDPVETFETFYRRSHWVPVGELAREPIDRTLRLHYPSERPDRDVGQLQREWGTRLYPTGKVVQHGPDRAWWPDGTPRSERFFELGVPVGSWTRWHEDGSKSFETTFAAVDAPRTTTFWHANGVKAGAGPVVAGIRHGTWTLWHENGDVAERGEYVDGEREGIWTLWYPGGAKRAEGEYAEDERVGTWTLWDEHGETFVKQGPPR